MRHSAYLAAQYSWRDDLKEYAGKIEALGIEVTSSWLYERKEPQSELTELTPRFLRDHALIDIKDIDRADLIILFTVPPITPTKRGGRHVEFGYALGRGKTLIICGPRENIFHYLPNVVWCATMPDLLTFLENNYATY